MKTLKELFYAHHFEDCVNAEKLPEEIKAKARDYVEKRDASFRAFGVTREDVARA